MALPGNGEETSPRSCPAGPASEGVRARLRPALRLLLGHSVASAPHALGVTPEGLHVAAPRPFLQAPFRGQKASGWGNCSPSRPTADHSTPELPGQVPRCLAAPEGRTQGATSRARRLGWAAEGPEPVPHQVHLSGQEAGGRLVRVGAEMWGEPGWVPGQHRAQPRTWPPSPTAP